MHHSLPLFINNSRCLCTSASLSACTISFALCLYLLSLCMSLSLYLCLPHPEFLSGGRRGANYTIPGDLSLLTIIKKCAKWALGGKDLVSLVLTSNLGFLIWSIAALLSSCPLLSHYNTLHFHLACTPCTTHSGEQKEHIGFSLHQKELLFNV